MKLRCFISMLEWVDSIGISNGEFFHPLHLVLHLVFPLVLHLVFHLVLHLVLHLHILSGAIFQIPLSDSCQHYNCTKIRGGNLLKCHRMSSWLKQPGGTGTWLLLQLNQDVVTKNNGRSDFDCVLISEHLQQIICSDVLEMIRWWSRLIHSWIPKGRNGCPAELCQCKWLYDWTHNYYCPIVNKPSLPCHCLACKWN